MNTTATLTTAQEVAALLRDTAQLNYDPASWFSLYRLATLKGGELPVSLSIQGDVRGDTPDTPDWGCRWVATHGTGNHGRCVLVAKTGRARRALFIGRIVRLVREFGLSIEEAGRFAAAQSGIKHGHEAAVIDLAIELVREYAPAFLATVPEWPTFGGAHERWVRAFDLPEQGSMSAPRYQAAWAIARAYHAGGNH